MMLTGDMGITSHKQTSLDQRADAREGASSQTCTYTAMGGGAIEEVIPSLR
jgi:hypothetical protein